jgi:hypothetical protein
MNDIHERQLESRLDRELRSLPLLKAPGTLSPRVMAAIAARQQAAWWRKSWLEWPSLARLLFLVLSASVTGAVITAGMQLPVLSGLTGSLGQPVASALSWFEPYLGMLDSVANALWLVVKAVPVYFWWLGLAFTAVAYGTCIGLGTLGYRLALNRI